MLKRNPKERLGNVNGSWEIKRHPFFSGINWDDAIKRKLKPPKPVIDSLGQEQKMELKDSLVIDCTTTLKEWSFTNN